MSAKNTTPTAPARTFTFHVDAGKAPAKTEEKAVITAYYDTRAGLKLDVLLDTLATCKTNAEREACVITWVGQMHDNDYSLGRVARAHPSYSPAIDPARSENKVKSAVRDVNAMNPEELAAVLAAIQAKLGA